MYFVLITSFNYIKHTQKHIEISAFIKSKITQCNENFVNKKYLYITDWSINQYTSLNAVLNYLIEMLIV